MTDTRYRWTVAALTLVAVLLGCLMALITAPFRSPDEIVHYNSVLRLEYGGGWPKPRDAMVAQGVIKASDQTRMSGHANPDDLHPQVGGRLPHPVPDTDRIRLSRTNGLPTACSAGDSSCIRQIDQMTQHPPLYYVGGAVVLKLTGLGEGRWDLQLLVLRLLSVAMWVPLVPLSAAVARRLSGSETVGILAACLTLFLPKLVAASGTVNNDALIVLVGAVATYLSARVLGGDRSWRTAVLLGVVIGLGLLTKILAVFLLPLACLAYLAVRSRDAIRVGALRAVVVAVLAFAVGGWWWLRNLVLYGEVQPIALRPPPTPGPPGRLGDFLVQGLPPFESSLFGGVNVPTSETVLARVVEYGLLGLIVVALVLGRHRLRVLLFLSPAVFLLGLVLANGFSFFRSHSYVQAMQGRYEYAGLAGLAAASAIGLWNLLRLVSRGRSPGRLERAIAPAVVTGGLLVAALGAHRLFVATYGGVGTPWGTALRLWSGWSPLSGLGLGTVCVLVVLAAVAAIAASIRYALPVHEAQDRVDEPTDSEAPRVPVA